MIDTFWCKVAQRQFEDVWNENTAQLLHIQRIGRHYRQQIDLYASTVWTEIERITMCQIRYMDDVRLRRALDKFNNYCSSFPEEHLYYGCFSIERWSIEPVATAVLYAMGGRVLIKPDPIELVECMSKTREIINRYWTITG